MHKLVKHLHHTWDKLLERGAVFIHLSILRWIALIYGTVFAALEGWRARFHVGVDLVSYLDAADALYSADWATFFASAWSPLYPALLGGMSSLLSPSTFWEFPTVQFAHFLIFLAAFFGFDWLVRTLFAPEDPAPEGVQAEGTADLCRRNRVLLAALAYMVFLWITFDLATVTQTNPDSLMAVFVYVAAALLVKIGKGDSKPGHLVLLGFVLGVGMLTKSVMMPLSILVLAFLLVVLRNRKPLYAIGLVSIAFVLVTSPYVLALSTYKGQFTYGGGAGTTYAWYVNGVEKRHWRGGGPDEGSPVHPTRQIISSPDGYEFDRELRVTNPLFFDTDYWFEGLQINFDLGNQVSALARNTKELVKLSLSRVGTIVVVSVLLVLGVAGFYATIRRLVLNYWPIVLFACAGIGSYLMILVSGRYIAPFVAIGVCALLASVRLPAHVSSTRLLSGTLLLSLLALSAELISSDREAMDYQLPSGLTSGHKAWAVAQHARENGLEPGHKVAAICCSVSDYMHWARLARVRIIAELDYGEDKPGNDFFGYNAERRREVMAAFREAGANAIVSKYWQGPVTEGWVPLGNTGYVMYLFNGSDS